MGSIDESKFSDSAQRAIRDHIVTFSEYKKMSKEDQTILQNALSGNYDGNYNFGYGQYITLYDGKIHGDNDGPSILNALLDLGMSDSDESIGDKIDRISYKLSIITEQRKALYKTPEIMEQYDNVNNLKSEISNLDFNISKLHDQIEDFIKYNRTYDKEGYNRRLNHMRKQRNELLRKHDESDKQLKELIYQKYIDTTDERLKLYNDYKSHRTYLNDLIVRQGRVIMTWEQEVGFDKLSDRNKSFSDFESSLEGKFYNSLYK